MKTLSFVVVFIITVLALLIGYELATGTRANEWYLFQVARSTSWLLGGIGDSCSLGGAERLRGREAKIRASLDAWARGERPPDDVPRPEEPAPPLTPWEAWQYKAGCIRQELADAKDELARLKEDTSLPEAERAKEIATADDKLTRLKDRESGPLVSFVLKMGLIERMSDAKKRLADVKTDTTLSEADRAERVADAEQELARLKEQVESSKQAWAGPPSANREVLGTKFAFIVIPDCGAIPSMAIFFAAVLAFPARWWKRFLGILIGIPILYGVNAFRLAFLAVIGAWDGGGARFKFAHEFVWQGIYIVFVVALWMVWVEFLVRRRE